MQSEKIEHFDFIILITSMHMCKLLSKGFMKCAILCKCSGTHCIVLGNFADGVCI